MEYITYEAAYMALVEENDGVLPDLYETVDFIISCHPSNIPAIQTVADVVAYAIIEMSTPRVVVHSPLVVPATLSVSAPVELDDLLERAVVSVN